MQKVGPEVVARLRARVVAELTTTFATHYTDEISLVEALDLEIIKAYSRQATGRKYLINPTL
jgi:NADPH2:quinone reductase